MKAEHRLMEQLITEAGLEILERGQAKHAKWRVRTPAGQERLVVSPTDWGSRRCYYNMRALLRRIARGQQ